MRPWVPVTHWLTKQPSKSHKRRGPTLRPRGASPGPHSGEGLVRSPYPTSVRSPTRASRQSVAAERKGEKKNKAEEAHKTLAASRPKKRASEGASEEAQAPLVQGESQNRPGPRMAPRKKRQEAGHTAKTGGTEKSGGTQKRKREQQNRCV